LMEAAYLGDVAKVNKLVAEGADIDAGDDYGWTAIRYAVRNNRAETTVTLIEHGADVNIASHTGRTPLMSAASNGLDTMCKILVGAGADVMQNDENGRTAYDLAMRGGPCGNKDIRDVVGFGQTDGTQQWTRE